MRIRRATSKDFEQVFRLLPQLWPDAGLKRDKLKHTFSRALQTGRQYFLCAIGEDRIIGFCSLSIRNSLWQQGLLGHIDELIVDSRYRGQGAGTRLVTEALKLAGKKGCLHVELDSAFHRKRAHGFYEKMGFEKRAYLFSISRETSKK